MHIDGTTNVYGILGDPVAHSLSPLMHNAAFAAINMGAVYLPFNVTSAQLAPAVAGLRSLGVKGVNVTIPHKEAVLPLLDSVDSGAELVGAVNTIVNRSGQLVGYNTDGLGLLRSLQLDLHVSLNADTEVIVLGAGGAARATIVALAQQGVKAITILNRSEQRAQSLVARYSYAFPQTSFMALSFASCVAQTLSDNVEYEVRGIAENCVQLTESFKKCHLIVNSTSIGLSGESFNVLPWNDINHGTVVYDMIYAARSTPLVQSATAAGFVACDGLGMLAAQGEAAFELWTGKCVDGLMRSTLKHYVAKLVSK